MNPIVTTPSPAYLALRREIEAIGEERGKTIGKAIGEADALAVVLRTRGFAVDALTSDRIAACDDVEQLRRWIARAVTAHTLTDVFAPTDDAE